MFCTWWFRWVRASAPAGCSPRGPGGVGLLLQGLFSPLSKEFYRVCRAHECEFGSLGLGLVAGRTLEPPHGARGRSVVSLSFLMALTHPFRSEGGVCLPSPLECEPRSLGPGKVAGRAPEPLARSKRAVRSSPGFLCDHRASFSLGRTGGICQATLGGRER